MKRVIIRLAALVGVVTIGLLAIAQAQRSSRQTAPETVATAEGQSAPGLLPPQTHANPLRGASPSRAAAEFSASPVRPAAHQSEPAPALVPASGNRPPAGPVDPFGLQGARPRDDAAAGRPDPPNPSMDEIPDASALQLPAEPDDRYARASDDRYARPTAASSPRGEMFREPAPFQADPLAAPARSAPVSADRPSDRGAGDSRLPGLPSFGADPPMDAPGGEGTGQPGGKQLEGPQSPQVTIEKTGPKEIQVGKPAKFTITVRNTGQVAAAGLEIRDQVPRGTRLMGTTPRASRNAAGELAWTLGTLKPGEQTAVEIELMPTAEGEIGSVATVQLSAEATTRAKVTKPELVVQTAAPGQVLIGEEVTLTITVSNTGSGVAGGVVVHEHIPAGLQHPAGGDLEYEVGQLAPGASKQLELKLTAAKAGPLVNTVIVRGDGSLRAEDRLNLEVLAPQLEVAMEGPKRRYLEREASYEVSVANPGTAAAKDIELVAYLPETLKFVSADNAGNYVEADHSVHWRLEELPARERGSVQLVTLPVEAGQQKIRVRGVAGRGLEAETQQPVIVEGIAAILFQAVDVEDPIAVGGETTYEIRVLNQGSKAATNVQLTVTLPAELKPVSAEGPTRHVLEGNRVVFEGLARLAPKADTTYQVRVQGLQPGDLRARIQLVTDEMQSPVTKEESTRVYADE